MYSKQFDILILAVSEAAHGLYLPLNKKGNKKYYIIPEHLAIVPKEQPYIIVVTLMVYAQIRLYKSRLTDYIVSDSR